MKFEKVSVNSKALTLQRGVERALNRAVRARDRALGALRLGGRKAAYDDEAYEFLGGPRDTLRARHYDKSLRLLWKAESQAPWSSFKDCTPMERALRDQARQGMNKDELAITERMSLPEFTALLKREYSRREREALVAILSAIGHGEAYAWLVSAELLPLVRSTGARTALTAQILEEAKHFVVLRELVQAFDVPVPRLSAWEYLLLEGVHKADGLEKLFGMNVLVEGIALSIFGMLSQLPGLDILRMFHLDESRHTALPYNYFREFPLNRWQRGNPLARMRRLKMLLPAVPLVFALEEDLAELGIDPFVFGGSVIRKVSHLAQRNGFLMPIPNKLVEDALNLTFNAYCYATRAGHTYRDYRKAESTRGERELAVEREVLTG